MGTEYRTVHLGDILTVTGDRMVAPEGIDAVGRMLSFMVGEPVYTNALPRVADECVADLLRQHPDLADVKPPTGGWTSAQAAKDWLAEQVRQFGEFRNIRRLADPNDHTHVDPVADFRRVNKTATILPIVDGQS